MFIEYDWTYDLYRIRFGSVWTSFRGVSDWQSLKDVKFDLERGGCKLGRKTDSRTSEVVTAAN